MQKRIICVYVCLIVLSLCSCDMRELPPPWELQPFYQAILRNDMETVQNYMKKYKHIANFDLVDITGLNKTNTVICAVASGNIEMLDLMIKNGANINSQTQVQKEYGYGGQTALHGAIQDQRKDMIEYLLNHNADVSIIDGSKNNIFHYMSQSYRDAEVFSLFQPYASELINQKRVDGCTPLVLLIYHFLVDEHGNNVQNKVPEALELLKLYLDNGADVSLLFDTREKFDLIGDLITYHENEYLKLLLSYLNTKLPNYLNGPNYVHLAIACGNIELVPVLIPLTENIKSVNDSNDTVLHFAAAARTLDVIPLLLENGVDKTLKDENGLTAYDLYVKNNPDIDENIANLLKIEE